MDGDTTRQEQRPKAIRVFLDARLHHKFRVLLAQRATTAQDFLSDLIADQVEGRGGGAEREEANK